MKLLTIVITIGLATATRGRIVNSNDAIVKKVRDLPSTTADGYIHTYNEDDEVEVEKKQLSLVTLDSGNPKDSAEYRLEPDAAIAFETLREKAKTKGYELVILSAFRTNEQQNKFYKKAKDLTIIKSSFGDTRMPGRSIFQTGRAVLVQIKDKSKREKADTWFASNAKTYQFCQGSRNTFGVKAIILHYNPEGQKCDPLVSFIGLGFGP